MMQPDSEKLRPISDDDPQIISLYKATESLLRVYQKHPVHTSIQLGFDGSEPVSQLYRIGQVDRILREVTGQLTEEEVEAFNWFSESHVPVFRLDCMQGTVTPQVWWRKRDGMHRNIEILYMQTTATDFVLPSSLTVHYVFTDYDPCRPCEEVVDR